MERHERYIRRCIELSYQAREKGNAPFASLLVLDGEVILEAENEMVTDGQPLAHSELLVLREACRRLPREARERSVLYSSAEPCVMCCGAILHSGVRHLVYGVSEEELQQHALPYPYIPSREVFSRLGVEIRLEGPVLAQEALKAHEGFWKEAA